MTNMKSLFFFLSLFMSLNVSAQKYVVNYQTYGNYNFYGKTIFLESSTKGLTTDDIEFREYSKYIGKLFSFNGASMTLDRSNANVIVYVCCAISEPQKDVYNSPTVSIPSGNYVWRFGGPRTYTSYTRYLELKAYTTSDSNNVWKATITSSGSSGDYSSILPVLCFSIRNSIGKASNNEIETNETIVNNFYR